MNINFKKNESFNLWSRVNFVLWNNARYDFELIAELLKYIQSTSLCLSILDITNKYIKNKNDNTIFFDGTIKSLKYLIKNKYLNISDIPEITNGHKKLKDLLKKYSKKVDIIDIFFDIEEPIFKAILIEYPHLLNIVLEDSLGRSLINKALIKNGVANYNDFLKKINNSLDRTEVSEDKYSKEAMKCKIIYVGLFLNNKKIIISKDSPEMINLFSTLTDKLIESENYSKGIINSLYSSLYGHNKWNKEKKVCLTGCELLKSNFLLLSFPENHIAFIYEMLLKNETEKIGKKYFGDNYNSEGFIASLAIKMIVIIIIFRSQDFVPKDELAEVAFFSKGALLDGLNYAVKESEKNGKKILKPKQWFINYYKKELEKRVAFIKFQVDNNISVVELREGLPRVIYLPIFESFRFFCSQLPQIETLKQIIKLFTNKNIKNEIKNDILVNFALNIQEIISQKDESVKLSNEENHFKDAFIILIEQIFKNLIKKEIDRLKLQSKIKSYYEESDLFSDASISIIELILSFDLTKNDSFIGYLKYNLNLKIKTKIRPKKSDYLTSFENELADDFMDSIPDENDLIEQINNKENIIKINEYINNLPEKQKEAIRKYYKENKKLSDSERKNKNRGLNKIKEIILNS
ncbi:MAG: hypothetical protein ACOXZ1_00220 [Patescibacteria group bacterium]|jgi:DNA-directed RNA polymerase specialized sigma subunit